MPWHSRAPFPYISPGAGGFCPAVNIPWNTDETRTADDLFGDNFCRAQWYNADAAAGEAIHGGWYRTGGLGGYGSAGVIPFSAPFTTSGYAATSGFRAGNRLAADTIVGQTTIPLVDASSLPSDGNGGPWGIGGTDASIAYTGKSGNTLTGVTGLNSAHTSGDVFGHVGGRFMAQHPFYDQNNQLVEVEHVFIRQFLYVLSDYAGGHEKMLDLLYGGFPAGGGQILCLGYNYFGSGQIRWIPYLHQDDGMGPSPGSAGWMGDNMGPVVTLTVGHVYYQRVEIILNTPGVWDGTFRKWFDDLGTYPNLAWPITPTLRSEYTQMLFRNGTTEAAFKGSGVWFEGWANGPSIGTLGYAASRASRVLFL